MNQEQIPQGFDPTVWEKLTPEQKQAYLNGASPQSNQPGQSQNMQAQQMQQQMMADAKKQAFMGMAFGLISSLVTSLLHIFLRRR